MRPKIFALFILFGSLLTERSKAQDIHFSQFYESTILRNPALAGIFGDDYKVSVQYRNQWSSISKPFITGQFSFETKIPVNPESQDFFSAGLLAFYDRAGSIDLKTLGFYPSVSFNKYLGDAGNSFLSVGFTGGYLQRSFDPGKVTTNSQFLGSRFDPNLDNGETFHDPKIHYFDIGAGVNFSSGGGPNSEIAYFLGISGYHFSKPKNSFYGNPMVRQEIRWNVNAGMSLRMDEKWGLIFQGNYASQGTYSELIAGGLLNWKKSRAYAGEPLFVLYGGAFLRLNDAIIPTVKLDYMRYSFGFSYDANISKLKAASNLRGGYEISLVKTGLYHDPKWERSRTTCPHAFF